MRARHAYAMLKMMGMHTTVAVDEDNYIDIAVRLGEDPRFYAETKQKVNKQGDKLFDDLTVIRALEDFFKRRVGSEAGKHGQL
ncbi:MAG: hypothetical protein JSW39_02180 [Desulfobacterales bacterium]|nr:MAG: hypothetical protein JSW39_02180 [Desulfobacterales bacterium]